MGREEGREEKKQGSQEEQPEDAVSAAGAAEYPGVAKFGRPGMTSGDRPLPVGCPTGQM